MRVTLPYGRQALNLDIDDANLVALERAPIAPNLSDPAAALRDALEHPHDYPALRRALTPEDQITIAIDEGIPCLASLLVPLLEHIGQAHVKPDAVTLVCPPPSSGQAWLDELPDEFEDVRVEVHQPAERKKLAYLATTRESRRVYLNRSIVDADQLVVMTRRGYDAWTGYAGAELALYPRLTDDATLRELDLSLETDAPGEEPWPIHEEAREVAWLMGAAQFFVQIIEGSGDGIANIVTGPLASSDAGQRVLDARWRIRCSQAADVVLAGVTGDRLTMDDLARAAFAAARVVRPGGSIVLLSEITPTLGPVFEMLRRHDDPGVAVDILQAEKPADFAAALLWARAAEQARLYLLSGLPSEVAEELFAIPLEHAEQARRLLGPDKSVIVLPDAHRTLAVLVNEDE